jgi:hypothetical protein
VRRLLLLLLVVPAMAACKNSSSYDSGRTVSPGTGLVWEDQPNGILAVSFGSQTGTVAEGDRIARLEKELASLRVVSNLLVLDTSDHVVRVTADVLQVGADVLTGVNVSADATAGGLDGALMPDTWYAVLVISSSGGKAPAALLTANPGSPGLPPGFNEYRRVGWTRSNGSSNFRRFRQTDRLVHFLPETAPGDSQNEAKRRIVENGTNVNLQPITGFSADDAAAPGAIAPPGVREMFVTTLLTAAGGAAAVDADAMWNQNGPAGTPTDPNLAHRRLGRCASAANNASICTAMTWIVLNDQGRIFAATNGGGTMPYTIDVEAYLDEGI